ncbi:kelch-like protein 32 isoform X1 [Ornithodoros turicata]|uniref:kelch-like protein 32 isoform X1 n=1 Tax=Ornithodoros turicata TaxID=34597 RepID=UPI003138F3CF
MEKEITLKVDGQKLVACRQALQQASSYFKAMFTSGMKESVADEVEIHDVDPKLLQVLVDVAHGKKIEISSGNVHDLLRSGSLFQFHGVVKLCTDYLIESLTTQSAVDVWIAGDTFAIKPLCRAAVSTLLWSFDEFSESETLIASCPTELLLTLLGRDQINVVSENVICGAVKRWLDHNAVSCTEEEITKVLSSVRYSYVDLDIVKALANCASELVGEFVGKVFDVRNNGKQHCTESKLSKQILHCLGLPRRARFVVPAVVVARVPCGECSDSPLAILVCNDSKKSFSFYSALPTPAKVLHGYVICTVGKNSYFLCGEYGIGSGRWNRDVFVWSPRRRSWEKVGTIPNLRRHCKTAVVGTRLYLLGGFGRFRVVLESMDVFDTSTGQWQTGATIPCPVFSSAVCGTSDSIYLFSGSVHRYDVLNDTWCPVTKSFPSGPYSAVEQNKSVVLIPENESRCIEFRTADASLRDLSVLERSATYACSVGEEIFCMNSEGQGALFRLGGEATEVQVDLREGEKVEGCFMMPFFNVEDKEQSVTKQKI